MRGSWLWALSIGCCWANAGSAGAEDGKPLAGTEPLTIKQPLHAEMLQGMHRLADRELARSVELRGKKWAFDFGSSEAFVKSVEPNRQRFREMLGAVDPAVSGLEIQIPQTLSDGTTVSQIRWGVAQGITGVGLLLTPSKAAAQTVIFVPDADWEPDDVTGSVSGVASPTRIPQQLLERGIAVAIPLLINRHSEYAGNPAVRLTDQTHREYVHRMSFEMGRTVVGYEVEKVLALAEALRSRPNPTRVNLAGVGQGGQIAFFAAALDQKIESVLVSGYFSKRESIWQETLDRNLWGQCDEFGDSFVAALIAPRRLTIEACAVPEFVVEPSKPGYGPKTAAPGRIGTAAVADVTAEFQLAQATFQTLKQGDKCQLIMSGDGRGENGSPAALTAFLAGQPANPATPAMERGGLADIRYAEQPMQSQVGELVDFTQKLMNRSDKVRDQLWKNVNRTNADACRDSLHSYRDLVYDRLIGRLPLTVAAPHPRTRLVIDQPTHLGYEVLLDVGRFEDGGEALLAGGILLIPKNLTPGKHPVVVCQHGLEGTPEDTITTDQKDQAWGAYKGFSTQLVQRGYIVYAPQNPYKGFHEFRAIQRKSNPLRRSLFSWIIPQHQQTLNWLATLPFVDPERLAFYGLSYGGKTAVRVPPLLPPSSTNAGYCLSICSADFNEWVRKNTSSEDRYSYVFTPEYEIFEWNMGHVANYAELSILMTPRPFMVERGHGDGVAPDEWVAWEFAKVKRHYDALQLGQLTELEVFNGPHTINGVGTFDFLRRHLHFP